MTDKEKINPDSKKAEDINSSLSKTAKNVSGTFLLSILSKIVNLGCNIVLVQHISKEAYGIAKIYFEFAFFLIIFFPRETIRKTAQKFCPDPDAKKEEKKYYIACQFHAIMSLLVMLFAVFVYLGFIIFGNESVRKNSIQLLVYILCGVMELFSEPIIVYMNLHIENKQIAVTIGNFGRVISNMVFAVLLGLDLWSFTLSRLCGSSFFVLYLLFIGIYKYKIDYRKMIPNIKELLYAKNYDGIDITELKQILRSFVEATGLKMILGNCEKIILSFVIKGTTEEKGEYSFIVENFSFLIRFLIEPLEETFYNLVNKIKNLKKEKKDKNKEDIAFRMLKLFIKLLLTFGTLLIGYFFVCGKELVQLVYTKKWSNSSTEKIGKVYAIYMAIISINGIIESFANATNNAKQMSRSNVLMIINSVLLSVFSIIFSQYDICGLIIGNALSMIIRINGNLYIIFSGKNEALKENIKTDNRNSIKDLFDDFCAFFKQLYLSLPSCVSIAICLIGCRFIKEILVNKRNIYFIAASGFIGVVNCALLYLFEKNNIKAEIKKLKTE